MDTVDPEPPDQLYSSREDAQQALQQWAKKHSFAVVFGRTKKTKGETSEYRKQWVYYAKHGVFKPKGEGKRDTTTRKEDYKWQAQLLLLPGTSSWNIKGISHVFCLERR